jgi:hypothetical protein
MDKDAEHLSHEQSLGIIEQMIAAAKNEHQEKGDGWLIWGWLLFIASTSSAACMLLNKTSIIGAIWTGMLFIGLAVGFVLSLRRKRTGMVTTYVQELLRKLGTGFFVSLFVMIASAYILKSDVAFGYYYILYAFWMFIHGSAIRFRPLIVGAIINWIAALAIFYTSNNFLHTMIISSIAIFCGYLVPGYMLRRQYMKSSRKGARI